MNINTPPRIATTIPKNYAIDIPTTLDTVTIGFTTDLDPNHIQGNVRLQSKEGAPIPIAVSYKYRTITVSIRQELSPNTQYEIDIFGDINLNDTEKTGIRSAIGVSMQGHASISFTTMKSDSVTPPRGTYPVDKTIVNEVPAFKWDAVDTAAGYEIEVSKSNSFTPVHWATKTNVEGPVYPSVPLGDGVYYWRVRSVDSNQKVSDWSQIYIFNLDTLVESPIVPEDTVAPELEYDRLQGLDEEYVEVIDVFPKESYSNVATGLKTVYFTILGTVSAEDVVIEGYGESVDGEGRDHGELSGTIEVVSQGNGTTMIKYTPDVLQNESI